MAQQQTSQAPTPVSFDDISLDHLSFNETFRVTRGSASQVVLGLKNMLTKLSTPENDYQRSIYPQLSTAINDIVETYKSSFLSVTEAVEKQVFGANLNGFRNDGSLYRSVNSGINRSLTYGYSQFGQLVRVLVSRLKFVVKRDPNSVERYKNSATEMSAYQKLQHQSEAYLTYLEGVMTRWNQAVEEARKTHGVQRETRPHREQREQREPRQQRHTREPRDNQGWTTVQRSSQRQQTVDSHQGGRHSGRGGRGGSRGGHGVTHHNTNSTRTQQAMIVNSA